MLLYSACHLSWHVFITFCLAHGQGTKQNSNHSCHAHTWTNTVTAVKKISLLVQSAHGRRRTNTAATISDWIAKSYRLANLLRWFPGNMHVSFAAASINKIGEVLCEFVWEEGGVFFVAKVNSLDNWLAYLHDPAASRARLGKHFVAAEYVAQMCFQEDSCVNSMKWSKYGKFDIHNEGGMHKQHFRGRKLVQCSIMPLLNSAYFAFSSVFGCYCRLSVCPF